MALVGKQERTTANSISANMESAHFEAGFVTGLLGDQVVAPAVSEAALFEIMSNVVRIGQEGRLSQRDLDKTIRHACGLIAGTVVKGEHGDNQVG